MRNLLCRFLLGVAAPLAASGWALAADYHVIPLDVDPPIAVDGVLDDWANVPNALTLKDKSQVAFNPAKWKGPDDLSAIIRLAWRNDGLLLAAEVSDDAVCQPLVGADFWKGDHIELFLDCTPGTEPSRTAFGAGQFQIGFSPGSLGGPGESTPPEMIIWKPKAGAVKDGRIVARRTEKGYVIEAFVPFAALDLKAVTQNQDINFEVAVSDTDALPPQQEKMITSSALTWAYARTRLVPAVFGDGNGKAAPPARSFPVQASAEVPAAKTLDLTVTAPAIPEGKAPFLYFQARFHYNQPAGFSARALQIEVNGKPVRGAQLSNRAPRSMYMQGKEAVFVAPDGAMTIPYTPTPDAFDKSPIYALVNGVKGCDFEFNVAGQLKEGNNVVTFRNLATSTEKYPYTLTLENIEVRLKAPVTAESALRPAPTGPLPVYQPQQAFPKTYAALASTPAEVRFTVQGEPIVVQSRFSAPDGQWHTGSTPFYKHSRKVIEHDEWIEVRDTFENTTAENVPIMHRHSCALGDKAKGAWLSCLPVLGGAMRKTEPANPSAFLATEKSGVGLLALDDVFRIHSSQAASSGTMTLGDEALVLKPGVTYTAEWAIVPTLQPDLWAFVNASRRLLDANFTLKYMFAFMFHRQPVWDWSDEMFTNFINCKSANFVDQSLYNGNYKGRIPQGIVLAEMPETFNFFTDFGKRLKRLYPDGSVKHAIYYHCFLDVMDESPERFKDCRILDAAGNHPSYGSYDYLKLYLPTMDNAWGREVAKGIDLRIDTLGCNAIYWDEFNESALRYTYNTFDGWSADIDGKTFKITRTKAAVHLAALDFLVHQAKRIMVDRGLPLLLNGAPYSRTVAQLKIQNFVETGSISNCHSTVLHSPVALGDHLTERSQQDCYNVMLGALDYGCLYNWYGNIIPSHKTLTEHMFPFTPIELHSGWVIGKERIVTKVSGRFGWGDASDFDIYVYDREGRATAGKEALKLSQDGNTWADLRLPEGFSAAIVRK